MKKIAKLLIVLVLLSLLAILITAVAITRSTRSKVTELRQEIQEQGDPLYFSDLTPESIDFEGNAFIPLMEAEEELQAFRDFYMENFDSDSPEDLSTEQLQVLAKKVEDSAELYTQLDRILACTELEADTDYSAGLDALLNHVEVLRSFSFAIRARTIAYASQQKGDEALQSCIDGMQISRLMKDEYSLVAFLVSINIQRGMSDDAFHVISTTPTSDDARAEMVQELSLTDFRKSLTLALKGERSLGVQTFRDLREGKGQFASDIAPRIITGIGFGEAYINNDEATYIELINRSIESVNQPYAERKQVAEEIQAELDGGFGQLLTKLILPAVPSVSESVDAIDAKIRCLQVICRSRTEGDGILQNLPEDPFNNQPVKTSQTADGWIVYSVGLNLQDDGGDLGTPDQNLRETPDIGYGPLPSNSSPAPESPAPESPAPESPAPESPAPESPASALESTD